MYSDETLTCIDCGAAFVFTRGEQEFYAQKGFQNKPSRCPDCRRSRKNRPEGARSGGRREMFTATCSNCGGVAEVPFQPSGDKPVYCRDCFQKMRAAY